MMRLEQRGGVAFTCMGIAVLVILLITSVLADAERPRLSLPLDRATVSRNGHFTALMPASPTGTI